MCCIGFRYGSSRSWGESFRALLVLPAPTHRLTRKEQSVLEALRRKGTHMVHADRESQRRSEGRSNKVASDEIDEVLCTK